jgi:uncharacterized protein YecE (DUF72 family)
MRLAVGTSGFAYDEWKGGFYPPDLKAAEYLRFYASRLGAVEINNTFYRMPKERVLLEWGAQVPPDFTFALKASMRITHRRRLKECAPELAYWYQQASALGSRLGATLFQLPPNLKKDLPRLIDFLTLLPAGARAALEFRHPSWFDDDVFTLLRQHDAALVHAEFAPEEAELEVPFLATASWGYLRLRHPAYDDAALAAHAARVRTQPWTDAFVFFKHEDAGAGPRLAARFRELAGAA